MGVSAALPPAKPPIYKGNKSTVKARSKRKWIIERKLGGGGEVNSLPIRNFKPKGNARNFKSYFNQGISPLTLILHSRHSNSAVVNYILEADKTN